MQVVADNRAGAGGNIGTEQCAKAPPDGYTVCMMTVAQSISPAIYRKLGFDPVVAVDFDEQAVEATLRNAAENGVVVDVALADLREDELPEAALALANIAADAVVALGPRLRAARAITSGYLVSDEPELEGYRRERRIQSGGWAADLHLRQ